MSGEGVERFHAQVFGCDEEGGWVRYSDHAQLLKEERERVERVRQELLERADQVASDGLAAHKGACRCCCKRCVGGAAFTSRAVGLREAAQLLADPDLPVGGGERVSGDFEGDRTCSTHHACNCLQQKAAERDHYKADLEALRGGVEAEVERLRREVAQGETGTLALARLSFDDLAKINKRSGLRSQHLANRLKTLLSGSTKPNPSLDPAGEEGTGG